jgi:uncharacterized protein YceH (UPF0502 family)
MTEDLKNQIRQLSRIQRRVIGVLMEKAFTTPEQYPLTLKAATTGCNQKNNREPVTEYSEDQVADTLEQLRQLGLIAEVFTDGGRAARYRHYMRQKFDFSETQFAVIAELLLRGRQQPGELRTRASRMSRIESSDQLKADLQSLQEKGFIQANGPLDRRGIEVDHTFYLPKEGHTLSPAVVTGDAVDSDATETSPGIRSVSAAPLRSSTGAASSASHAGPPVVNVSSAADPGSGLLAAMTDRITELSSRVEQLELLTSSLQQRMERIEREFGL